MTFRLVGGDAIGAMQAMAENSVDAIVTDPPYGLEFMGKEWDAFRTDDPGTKRHRGEAAGDHGELAERDGATLGGRLRVGYGGGKRAKTNRCVGCGRRDQFRNEHKPCGAGEWKAELIDPHAAPPTMLAFGEWSRIWATQALRILKPGGHLLAFGGTRTYHRLACAIEDAGFEIRDCIAWMYGSGFPKSLNIGDGMGTALKPAFEPIVLARKPLSERNVAANVQRHGVGALNIDGTRIAHADADDLATSQSKNPGRDDLVSSDVYGAGRPQQSVNASGRWPANAVFDETAAAMLDEQTGETSEKPRILNRNGARQMDGWGLGAQSQGVVHGDTGGASRFFYCPKADREERNRGLGHMPAAIRDNAVSRADQDNEHARRPNRNPVGNHHPTVKPVELMRWLCRMVTPKGGTVLDPFCGSGSTGVAAMREGFEFIGIEREAEYVEIARARIIGDAPLFNVEDPPNE